MQGRQDSVTELRQAILISNTEVLCERLRPANALKQCAPLRAVDRVGKENPKPQGGLSTVLTGSCTCHGHVHEYVHEHVYDMHVHACVAMYTERGPHTLTL